MRFLPFIIAALTLGLQAQTPPFPMVTLPAPPPATNTIGTNSITGTWNPYYTNCTFEFGWLWNGATNWINCGQSLSCTLMTTDYPQEFYLAAVVGTNWSTITNAGLSVIAPSPPPSPPTNVAVNLTAVFPATNPAAFYRWPTNVNVLTGPGVNGPWQTNSPFWRASTSRTYLNQ